METLLGIVFSTYFWFTLAIVMSVAGGLGFFFTTKVPGIDFLASRRFFRLVLVAVVVGHLFFTSYQPSGEFDPQSLLPEEEKDWLTFWGNIFLAYFGAWALVSGLEKRVHNPFVFFYPTFYQKIENPKKKK
jgi:hypothetical protein